MRKGKFLQHQLHNTPRRATGTNNAIEDDYNLAEFFDFGEKMTVQEFFDFLNDDTIAHDN